MCLPAGKAVRADQDMHEQQCETHSYQEDLPLASCWHVQACTLGQRDGLSGILLDWIAVMCCCFDSLAELQDLLRSDLAHQAAGRLTCVSAKSQAAGNPDGEARVEAGSALLEVATQQLPTALMWQVYMGHLYHALQQAQVRSCAGQDPAAIRQPEGGTQQH